MSFRSERSDTRPGNRGWIRCSASLEEVARRCELVISLVTPTSAIETARRFAAGFDWTRGGNGGSMRPMFIDANSASPRTKQCISEILSHAGICTLDGAFFGPANQLGADNVLALSGPGADQIAPLLQEVVEVRVTGSEVGQASAPKMALAIITKGLPALFLETVCASADAGQLGSSLSLMRRLYPGIMQFLERTLPTYPTHVARRVHELQEVADWLHERGQRGMMTGSAVAVLEELHRAELESNAGWTFESLLHHIADADLLHAS
jgi:3-hydroxyisobutyrate dehydrogenase-like beta-hydroxyacid dehydrogenase